MIIKLKVEEPKIVFDPAFKEIRDIILRCFSEIVPHLAIDQVSNKYQ
jgi:dynein heavy chain